MIKIDGKVSVEKYNDDGTRVVKTSLISDNEAEVIAMGTDGSVVIGLSVGDILAFGSDCLTTDQTYGILDSLGNWKF